MIVMRFSHLLAVFAAFIAFASSGALAMSPSDAADVQDNSSATFFDVVSIRDAVEAMPKEDLNESETSGLLYMREEEKLARDAYEVFNETYGLRVFGNIGAAEETHMESVGALIEKYELDDPILDAGNFSDPDLQALYDDLVAQGNSSVEEALKVGAVIEETDIQDLKDRLAETDNEDVILVYEALMRGSRNHLRAFVNNLERRGIEYSPSVLTQEEFDEIVSSGNERGPYQS
ncbi:MAG TPA: DUF2202 domain-containing protein [Methanothrix sp.]|nr:DUF2202 domain-containing protein [Methanothrix sp.]